jgi:hypothetical protein
MHEQSSALGDFFSLQEKVANPGMQSRAVKKRPLSQLVQEHRDLRGVCRVLVVLRGGILGDLKTLPTHSNKVRSPELGRRDIE